MSDLQTKFAITLVALGFLFTYAIPSAKKAKHDHDTVIQQVGQVYIAPDPAHPNAPSGNISLDEAQK